MILSWKLGVVKTKRHTASRPKKSGGKIGVTIGHERTWRDMTTKIAKILSEYVSEYTSECISEYTSECTSDYVREYISEYVREYTIEYVREYFSEKTAAPTAATAE